jgi:hypothetical protein
MKRTDHPFEMRVFPVGNADLGVELIQSANGNDEHQVVRSWGPRLQAVSDHLLEALKESGHRPHELRRNREKPFMLREASGVRLALVLLATKPLRKLRRIEDISSAVRQMSDDEAYYWYAKCSDLRHGRRAQRAFRDLLSDR